MCKTVAFNWPALQGFAGATAVLGAVLLAVGCTSPKPIAPTRHAFAPTEPVRFSVTIKDEAPVQVTLNQYGQAFIHSQEQLGGTSTVAVQLSALDAKGESVAMKTDGHGLTYPLYTSEAGTIHLPTRHVVTYQMYLKLKPSEEAVVLSNPDTAGQTTKLIRVSRLD